MSGPGADLTPAPRTPGGRRSRAWWLPWSGRVILVAVAAAGSAFALLEAGREPSPSAAVQYRCPMHPDAVAPEPATCPVCGMALVLDQAPRRATVAHSSAPRSPSTRAVRRTFAEQVRAPAWVGADHRVVALLYRDDLVGLVPGQLARFVAAREQAVEVDVVLAAEPPGDWDRDTAHAAFTSGGELLPDQHGMITIPPVARELLVVPSSAIVQTGDGPCVFAIDPASHRAARRMVRTGREHRDVTAVLDGLIEGEDVVVTDAFFVAAERGLHPGEAP